MIGHGFGVLLGTLDRADLWKLRAWRNNYDVWKWTRQNDLISEQAHEAWFTRQAQDPAVKMYGIYDKDKLVGVTGLTSIDLYNRRAEFSLYIDPDRRGLGLGQKALQTLCAHAFKTLNLETVWGETFEGNPAARMFERVGFKFEGARRRFYYREGKYLDAHLYSLLKEEFK